MLLTEASFRSLKSLLSRLDGCPGSSRLGEAMAAGWGFGSYEILRTHLDAVETGRELPEDRDPHPDLMLDALGRFGCKGWKARDIAATFAAESYGSLLWDDYARFPEIHGARVMRPDILSDAGQEAARTLFDLMRSELGVMRIMVTLPEDWREGREFLDIGGNILLCDERHGPHRLEHEDVDLLGDLKRRHGVDVLTFWEGLILRIRDQVPDPWPDETAFFSGLVLDGDGLRALCRAPHQGRNLDIWFAAFHDGPVDRSDLVIHIEPNNQELLP
ncbi:hypothetical protein LAZ40_05495 [Cereibacter sphaeroides]|uniref:hypothetical protein n=1 Tax=Cereibacter sphaeroides TaxID=1063 RepID=UPI001F3B4689|nr:hypothetical protein [Cereibacter sphaeroides]MCE6958503.1 hypothetical protein [Cereibacter sphaeroides]MCE6972835.1 hypothetical protein [Cereibacter sphaeroides]